MKKPHALVVSGSSDIGARLIDHWINLGWTISATYRRMSSGVRALQERGAEFYQLDLSDASAVNAYTEALRREARPWNIFMTCPATMEPIAPFLECRFSAWERSFALNFTRQAQILHAALPLRRSDADQLPIVILWAGPGTNNAPPNYSAEIVAKIAQIKLCEILDAEISDCRFVILGPGWVATKIHQETLSARQSAGANFERTKMKLGGTECTPMERITGFVDWAISQPKHVVSGRNFSIVNDIWGDERLALKLATTPDAFKLRRFLNDWNGG
jgi:NAD(P)-dependent dehydrogenase (short-subunit alcohol dehydrogenase family)